ncbi:MAG TPA: hypothetical protein VFK20_09215 [Vicinamibacterales bacterium]|nr:hypothetical protein [Vicinamibacterales bacterium]
MDTTRIEFISSYCDRWCERCAYTARCAAFACHVAVAMCGDVAEGYELAVGAPHPVDGEPPGGEDLPFDLPDISAEDIAEFEQREAARAARIQASPLIQASAAYAICAHRWLADHQPRLALVGDPLLVEALDVVMYDAAFIGAKLHRALSGRERHEDEENDDVHPVQNDWNGSAKVALISIERSETAWRVIAQASGAATAASLAGALADLEWLVRAEFPHADAFVRPGFDEPWR